MAISHITGGQYVPLGNANLLPQVIIGGAQEEISLQQLMDEVNANVRAELEALPDGTADQAAVEETVYKKLQAKGRNTKHLGSKARGIPEVSANARGYSEMGSMQTVSAAHKKNAPAQSPLSDMHSMSRALPRGAAYSHREAAEFESVLIAPDEREAEPDYTVSEEGVSQRQVSRMVQKALYYNNLKSKCKSETPPS
jgi:hypothetical protein